MGHRKYRTVTTYKRQDNKTTRYFLKSIKSPSSVKTTLFLDVMLCALVDADVFDKPALVFRVGQ
jgi:hypothetical protein